MTDRPLREVIAHIVEKYGPHDPEATADAILAALPQTEVSEAVREALEPFAKIAEEINKDYHDSRQIYQYGDLRLYGADFRRARQALALPVDNTSGDSDG